MRRHINFDCAGAICIGSIDEAKDSTGLFIISGGNEIRSGAHGGQAAMATQMAAHGFPVFRYDRRGIGDSEGENQGFEGSGKDIAAALAAFRKAAPQLKRIIAFGNCDAATAVALFHDGLALDGLILGNPWIIEAQDDETANAEQSSTPSAAAIRARYWARLKNPRSIIDLFSGKINLRKLAGGLYKASQNEAPSLLSGRLAAALGKIEIPVTIILANRDSTAIAFQDQWKREAFNGPRNTNNIQLIEINSASHSFADESARDSLFAEVKSILATR